MYQVIATRREDQGKLVKPFWIAKTYPNKTRAQEFVARQQHNSKYVFEIRKAEKVAS